MRLQLLGGMAVLAAAIKFAEDFKWIIAASGIIAGESLSGMLLALLAIFTA